MQDMVRKPHQSDPKLVSYSLLFIGKTQACQGQQSNWSHISLGLTKSYKWMDSATISAWEDSYSQISKLELLFLFAFISEIKCVLEDISLF